MRHHPKDWSAAGDDCGWDGNLDKPTLQPSIRLREGQKDFWHGHLTGGKFIKEKD